ncbi:glycosyltransferase family 4 protein [Leptolyngbya sp. 'hensonii']|uniref:glycosyltransferase family 4 protein n=1 Tax=Leptolyngbya sp. 'hensonii' TaxID=1922337 RepID=UPI000A6C55FB|nr:glycosyltransferase family 4 protein [Leptolyngbya sp. 'hensonii']
MIVSDLSPSGAGRWGGAVRPFLIAQALQKLGCSVEILGFGGEGNPELVSSPKLPIYSFPARPYPGFLESSRQLCRAIQGDLVYAYKLKPSSFGLACLYKRWTRKPLFLDIDDWEMSWHGGDTWRYSPNPKQLLRDIVKRDGALRQPDHPFYLQKIESWVKLADVVTTHNQFLRSRFSGYYIPNGKDVTLFDPKLYSPEASRQRYGLANYRVLMFPGAPRPYKGVEDVLEALEQLNEPDLRLVIVGGSPYDDYDTQLKKRWGKWIIQLPKTPVAHMPAVIAAAHVVVVPQQNEPAAQAQFPLKLTDGMAMAKPILATQVGDIPLILGETGYLVAPSAPDQLASQIQHIFSHWEEATDRGLAARDRCTTHYSLDAMATQLANIFAETHLNRD